MPNTFNSENFVGYANAIITDLRWLKDAYVEHYHVASDGLRNRYERLVAFQAETTTGQGQICVPEYISLTDVISDIANVGKWAFDINKNHNHRLTNTTVRQMCNTTVKEIKAEVVELRAELLNLAF